MNRYSTVQSEEWVCPGRVRGGFTGSREAEVPARRARRVVALKRRWLYLAGGFHPAQPLQVGEVNNKAVIPAAVSLIGDAGKTPVVKAVYVVRIDGALLAFCYLLFGPGGFVHG